VEEWHILQATNAGARRPEYEANSVVSQDNVQYNAGEVTLAQSYTCSDILVYL